MDSSCRLMQELGNVFGFSDSVAEQIRAIGHESCVYPASQLIFNVFSLIRELYFCRNTILEFPYLTFVCKITHLKRGLPEHLTAILISNYGLFKGQMRVCYSSTQESYIANMLYMEISFRSSSQNQMRKQLNANGGVKHQTHY